MLHEKITNKARSESSVYANNGASSAFGKPSNQTGTKPAVALAGKTHTRVLSLQRCVEVAVTSPKTQANGIFGWKLAPSTVTSIPPNVGPELGMSLWIMGICTCKD